jgi:hypothetical protein
MLQPHNKSNFSHCLVGTATMLHVRRSGARIPAWARHSVIPPTLRTDLPLSICCSVANPQKHYRLCGHFSFIFSVYRSSFPGIKRPGRDGDHSRPSIDEVKNEWNVSSTPPTRLRDVDKNDFTFFFTLCQGSVRSRTQNTFLPHSCSVLCNY